MRDARGMPYLSVKIADNLEVRVSKTSVKKPGTEVIDHFVLSFTVGAEKGAHDTIASPEGVMALLALAKEQREALSR